MSDDWDIDDEPVVSGSSTPAPIELPPKPAARTKWAGEDEEEDEDDWDKSEDEKPKPKAGVPAAAPKKKMTLKQKLAEKERAAAEAKANGDDDDLIDTMTVQERARLNKQKEQETARLNRQRELDADLAVASDLLGGADLDAETTTLPEPLLKILTTTPKSKQEYNEFSAQLYAALLARHESNPLFPGFVEQFTKDLCESLNAVQTRKVGSSLSVLGNTKQQEERDKASGKKKTTAKPKLAAVKSLGNKVDTDVYDDVLDDGDFM